MIISCLMDKYFNTTASYKYRHTKIEDNSLRNQYEQLNTPLNYLLKITKECLYKVMKYFLYHYFVSIN